MGIGINDLKFLMACKSNGYLQGLQAICDIGASQLYLEGEAQILENFANAFERKEIIRLSESDKLKLSNNGYFRDLWAKIGYFYISIDTSCEAGAINLDLNFDEIPAELQEKFQLVINCGTTEHVANQIQAFKIIHDLTAVEGLMYHNVPFQGYQTHGLINYTPKFFWMLCRSNNYEFLDFSIHCAKNEKLHPDILLSIEQTKNKWENINFQTTTSGIRVLLRKKNTNCFVPPFDGHVEGALNKTPLRYNEIFKK